MSLSFIILGDFSGGVGMSLSFIILGDFSGGAGASLSLLPQEVTSVVSAIKAPNKIFFHIRCEFLVRKYKSNNYLSIRQFIS